MGAGVNPPLTYEKVRFLRAPHIDLIKILGVSEWSPMSTPDFFRSRLDAMIDLRHPLAVLAKAR